MDEKLEVVIRRMGEVDLLEEGGYTLETGDEDIDEFLSLEIGVPILIFGTAFVGKTTLCTTIAISAVSKGQKVLYIDSERGLNPRRLRIISKTRKLRWNLLTKRLKVMRIYNVDSIVRLVEEAYENQFDLIIIDSISRPFLRELYAKSIEELEGKYELLTHNIYSRLAYISDKLMEEDRSLILVSESKYGKRKGDKFYIPPIPFPSISVIAKIGIGMFIKKGRRFMFIERHCSRPAVYESNEFLEFKIAEHGLEYVSRVCIDRDKICYYLPIS
ncbi:MAG: hypothetical protein DRJ49_02030 [Thermoprotei archaeon]|nr:MAG: hypothetical protein DRJ49_02030 [Thermoprotei archaeon]